MEIFLDRGEGERYSEFIRGAVTVFEWGKEKPAFAHFKDAISCGVKNGRLLKWRPLDNWDRFHFDKGQPLVVLPRKLSDPLREHASIKDGVITFRTADHTRVALFPKGVTPPRRPFLYKTSAEQAVVHRKVAKIFSEFSALEAKE